MSITRKPLRLLSAAALLSASAFAASAQTSPSTPSSPPADKPPMAKPETKPAPQATPSTEKPGKVTTAKETHPMVGRTALSSDGNKVGDVRAVKTGPDGKVMAIQLKVGGFLGFGGKIVEVEQDRFTQKGDTIQLSMTSEELNKLPEVKDAS